MKLSELASNRKIKLLLVGQSGVGKTVFSCSGPGQTKVFDFDNKLGSVLNLFPKEKLEQIDADSFTLDKTTHNPYDTFKRCLEVTEKLNPFPYTTVVLDSLTLFADALMADVVKKNPGIKRPVPGHPGIQDWGMFGARIKEDIHRLLALPCNVICIAHSTTQKDEVTEEIKNTILLSGRSVDHLPRIFPELWWAFSKVNKPGAPGQNPVIERYAQTQNDGRYMCNSQIKSIPFYVTLNFPIVQKYFQQPVQETKELMNVSTHQQPTQPNPT